jgi:hypothetical protein
MEAAGVAKVEAVERNAVEQAAHWAAKIVKALAYRRDAEPREGGHRAVAQQRLERCITMRYQDTAIRVSMVAIDPAGNGNGATQP